MLKYVIKYLVTNGEVFTKCLQKPKLINCSFYMGVLSVAACGCGNIILRWNHLWTKHSLSRSKMLPSTSLVLAVLGPVSQRRNVLNMRKKLFRKRCCHMSACLTSVRRRKPTFWGNILMLWNFVVCLAVVIQSCCLIFALLYRVCSYNGISLFFSLLTLNVLPFASLVDVNFCIRHLVSFISVPAAGHLCQVPNLRSFVLYRYVHKTVSQ